MQETKTVLTASMTIKEETVKLVYEGHECIGIIKPNGGLNIGMITWLSYTNVDQAFKRSHV